MKILLFLLAIALFPLVVIAQDHASFIGVPNKNDSPRKIITTSEGYYLIAGAVDNDASLYKLDCGGSIIDSLRYDLPVGSSFEDFFDVLELPNGEFLAVGSAEIGSEYWAAVVLTDAQLNVLAFDTLRVSGKLARARSVARLNDGRIIVAGIVQGEGLNFSDFFTLQLDPTTLQLIGTPAIFNHGVDEEIRVQVTADGNLLLSGVGVFGNVFVGDNPVRNDLFVRKTKPDGTLTWEYTFRQNIPNKFGRSYFRDAIENPATGNIVAAGRIFTGDTLNNSMDAYYTLLSPTGDSLYALQAVVPGNQEVYQTVLYNGAVTAFISVGDSIDILAQGTPGAFSAVVVEGPAQLALASVTIDQTVPLSIRSIIPGLYDRVAYASAYTNPFSTNPNRDWVIITPDISVEIIQDAETLIAVPTPAGSDYQYQWYLNGVTIPGAAEQEITIALSGTYTVRVTDPNGCTDNNTIVGTAVIDMSAFQIYPNPVAENLTIAGSLPEELTLSLLDATGRTLRILAANWPGGTTTFDLSGLPTGLYFLKMESARGVGMRKLIKE